jgi:hypothetical protein
MLLTADLNLAQGGSTCIATNGVIAQGNALPIKYSYAGSRHSYTLTSADKTLAMHGELANYSIDGFPTHSAPGHGPLRSSSQIWGIRAGWAKNGYRRH